MKRGRALSLEHERNVGVDWLSLFHIESVLFILHRYLSTPDLIHLSCVNKRMNTTWINNERRLSVLGMRNRVYELTGRKYKGNPLVYIKKASLKARTPVPIGTQFKCWKCRKDRLIFADQTYFKHKTCPGCAETIIRKHNIEGMDNIYWCLFRELPKLRGGLIDWFKKSKSRIKAHVEPYEFYVDYMNWVGHYIPESALKEVIEWAKNELEEEK